MICQYSGTIQDRNEFYNSVIFDQLLQDITERRESMYLVPFRELDGIQFSLSPTPEEDLAGFNENYAYVQSYANRVASILMNIKKEIGEWRGLKSRTQAIFRKAKNTILVQDPSIKTLKNMELQTAAIQSKVPELIDLLEQLDILIDSLETDADVVKIKKELLDNANTNLSRQQRVVEAMISLNIPVGVYRLGPSTPRPNG